MTAKVEPDPKPSFPFSMVESMMPMYPLIALMGWMLVVISFVIGFTTLSSAVTEWFSEVKADREASTALNDAQTTIHVIETWLPNLKFLGLGLGLLAINMALGTIAKKLRHMGKVISYHIEESQRQKMPEIPNRVRLFQGSAMMGIMILMATLIIGLVLAFGTVTDYYESDTQAGHNLDTDTSDLGTIAAIPHWLGPLRMMGMAFLFAGITIALTVIIGTLKYQEDMLKNL
ncbi:MAG: hypothetical protein IH840_12185 [Candidatus Heimdallarchaeota archaeon]|nr:hypothetical protein [Candidatus Heimdallarchaeota archaeon]